METYKSKDGAVTKFVHDDGSETVLKFDQSCEGTTKKNKAVFFISSSIGCEQGCKFCFLTQKKYPYIPLSSSEIVANVKEAIEASKPELKDKYVKFSFMGMGDCASLKQMELTNIVLLLISYVLSDGCCKGLDGIDVASSMPRKENTTSLIEELNFLNRYLYNAGTIFPGESILSLCNPHNKYCADATTNQEERTIVRLFVSFPSVRYEVKHFLMPNSLDLLRLMNELDKARVSTIFHCFFLDGVNDTKLDIELLKELFTVRQYQLRMLRYNKCPGSSYYESQAIESIIQYFKDSKIFFKYQKSPGSEVLASCGQFICRKGE